MSSLFTYPQTCISHVPSTHYTADFHIVLWSSSHNFDVSPRTSHLPVRFPILLQVIPIELLVEGNSSLAWSRLNHYIGKTSIDCACQSSTVGKCHKVVERVIKYLGAKQKRGMSKELACPVWIWSSDVHCIFIMFQRPRPQPRSPQRQ